MMWGLIFFFPITLLPEVLLHKCCTIPVSVSDFCACCLSVFMAASPGLRGRLVTTHPGKNLTQTSDSARSLAQKTQWGKKKRKKKKKGHNIVSFPLTVIVLLFVLSYTTQPHHPLLQLLEKTELCIHEPRGTRMIPNDTICRGNDLFCWAV